MAQEQEVLIEVAQKENHVAAVIPETARARVEIDELLADNDMTNLFLLALEAMYPEDPNKSGDTEDWWTFYSLASMLLSFSSPCCSHTRLYWVVCANFVQVYMASQRSCGTMSQTAMMLMTRRTVAIARMAHWCFRRGIASIWRCSR